MPRTSNPVNLASKAFRDLAALDRKIERLQNRLAEAQQTLTDSQGELDQSLAVRDYMAANPLLDGYEPTEDDLKPPAKPGRKPKAEDGEPEAPAESKSGRKGKAEAQPEVDFSGVEPAHV